MASASYFVGIVVLVKFGGAGGWFGDHTWTNCANFICVSGPKRLRIDSNCLRGGRNEFTNTKFTRPNTQISNSGAHARKGPSIYDVRKIWGFFDPLPPLVRIWD